METQAFVNVAMIGVGAVVMLVNLVLSMKFSKYSTTVRAQKRARINLYFSICQGLMLFFFVGYLASIGAIMMDYPLLTESFVSMIFLLGSFFVYLFIVSQRKLLAELQIQEIRAKDRK